MNACDRRNDVRRRRTGARRAARDGANSNGLSGAPEMLARHPPSPVLQRRGSALCAARPTVLAARVLSRQALQASSRRAVLACAASGGKELVADAEVSITKAREPVSRGSLAVADKRLGLVWHHRSGRGPHAAQRRLPGLLRLRGRERSGCASSVVVPGAATAC